MPAPKSSSGGSRGPARSAKPPLGERGRSQSGRPSRPLAKPTTSTGAAKTTSDGLASAAEHLTERVIKQLDLVMLTRERIQETLDEAAERGRRDADGRQRPGRRAGQPGPSADRGSRPGHRAAAWARP